MDELLTSLVPLLVIVGLYGFFGLVLGLLAKRKNRNPWAWGLLGALALLPGAIVLMFMPYLCPCCRRSITNKQARADQCPSCDAAA